MKNLIQNLTSIFLLLMTSIHFASATPVLQNFESPSLDTIEMYNGTVKLGTLLQINPYSVVFKVEGDWANSHFPKVEIVQIKTKNEIYDFIVDPSHLQEREKKRKNAREIGWSVIIGGVATVFVVLYVYLSLLLGL